jgi:two-component system NarL family sensor kinase
MPANLLGGERARRLSVQALAVLGAAILLGGIATFAYYATLPYAGFELSGGVGIGAVLPGSPAEVVGLQVGDQVLATDGEPFRAGRAYLQPGQEVLRLTVSRDGQTFPVEIPLAPPSLAERFYTCGHLLVALAFWIVAMAVLAFKPRDAVARLFVLVTLLGTLALVVWLLADLGLAWANILMADAVVWVGALFVHFHTLFPESARFRGRGALLTGLYVSSLVLLLLSTASDLAYYSRPGLDRNWLAALPTTQAVGAFFLLCLLIGLAVLIRTHFFAVSETSRRRAGLVLGGTALAVLPLIALIAIPRLLSAPYPVPTWLPLLALALIPLSYVYGMYHHDLLKLDGAVNRTVVFYLLALTLTGLYLGASLVARRLLPDASAGTITGMDAALFVGLALLVNPLKQRAQVAVDRVLYGGWYDYRSFISDTSAALRDAPDVPGVSRVLAHYLTDTMHFQSFALLLPDPQGPTFVQRGGQGFGDPPALGRTGVLAHCLLDLGKPVEHAAVCVRLSAESAAGQQLAAWAQAGAELWVPLVQQGELLGLLVLGKKQADGFVTQGDLDILDTLAQQVAVALRRLHLVDELQGQMEEVRAMGQQILALQERNRHNLSHELHDLVLQRLIVARHSLEQAQADLAPTMIVQAREILVELTLYVRSITVELRAPDWEETDLREALEDYALSFEDKQGLPVELQVSGQDPGALMQDEVRTAVYRIFQESLTNAWKHAQAEQIDARLELQPDRVRLEVRDDGVGFAVTPQRVASRGHLGLVSMRERAAELGGTCGVESEPGKGTRVRVVVPIPS